MIALDTNVVVRFLVNDDAAQARRSRSLIESSDVLVVPTVVLETEWVLRGAYGLPIQSIGRLIREFLGLPRVFVESAAGVAQALDWYQRGLDFADAIHLALSTEAGQMATFDRDFVRLARKLAAGKVISP